MVYCRACKEEIVEGGKFCVKCGTLIEAEESEMCNIENQTDILDEHQDKVGIVNISNGENASDLTTDTELENVNKKKSKSKILVGLISAGVVGLLTVIAVVLIVALNKKAKVDIGSFAVIEYSGYNTIGEATVKIAEDELIEAIADSLEKDEDDIDDDIRQLVENFSYEISNNGELANGDSVKIVIKYDEEMAEKCKLEVLNASFSCKVENLQQFTEIDPFQYLKIKFEGCSGDGKVSIEKDITSEAVENLNFTIDKDTGLYNGDKITISLEESEKEKGLKLGYKFIVTDKEYEVADLSSFYESLDDISEEKMKAINEVTIEAAVKSRYKSIKDYVELDEDIDYIGSYFIKDVQEAKNNIIISIFKCKVRSLDGSFDEWELYLPIRISNLYYGNNDFIQALMGTLGSINVRGKDYLLPGYLSDNELYTKELYKYIEGNNSSNYIVEVTDGVPSQLFSQRIEEKISNPENDDSDINMLIKKYIEVMYVKADLESMKTVVDDVSNINIDRYKSRRKYIESYENVSCNVLETTVINEYIVYVTYDAKLYNVETLAPSAEAFIVRYDNYKERYYIHNMCIGEQFSDFETVFNSAVIQQLGLSVEKSLKEALYKDVQLREIYNNFISVSGKKEEISSAIKKVLDIDLSKSYPYTVRGVVELFTSIQKCYYNEKHTENELVGLAYKATELFDEELVQKNSFDKYYDNLKQEINLYKKTGKYIHKVLLEENSEVEYTFVDNQSYASIKCIYYLKDENGTSKVSEIYVLRKDEDDRWRILGWELYENAE